MPPQQNSRAAWPSNDDNGGFFLAIAAIGLCVAAYLLWDSYHGLISGAVMEVHHKEITLLRHFTGAFNLADAQMRATNPEVVGLRDLYGIAHAVGGAVRIPAAALMLLLGLVCMLRAAPSRFRRTFDLDGLIREQAVSFPTTAAFVERRLRLVAPLIEPRPADYALTVEEWITGHAIGKDGKYDAQMARHNLVLQLGPVWEGSEKAAPHVRALFAVFALHLQERRMEALRLLGQISVGLQAKPGDDNASGPEAFLAVPDVVVADADAFLRDAGLRSAAAAVAGRHGYTTTAMMSLLNEARLKGGVLAPGQLAWLKLVDRGLWYALHSLGFETDGVGRYLHPNARVEAVASRDHWAAERVAGRALLKPDIDRADDAIRKAAVAPRPGKRVRP